MTEAGLSVSKVSWRTRLIVLGLIWIACTAPVIDKLDNELIFDDVLVVNNAFIHQPERIGEAFVSPTMVAQGHKAPKAIDTYRPIPLLTFFWDAWLSGHETFSYHVTNHVLHLAVVSALFLLALDLLPMGGVGVAAFVALFLGLSPQLGEGHVWINGRSDPLAALFGLLALWVWNRTLESPKRWAGMLGAGVLFAIGLLSKEVLACTIPSLLLWPRSTRLVWWKRATDLGPFVIATMVYAALRLNALHGLRAAQNPGQVWRALHNLPLLWIDGLRELLLPSRLYLRSLRDEYAAVTDVEHMLVWVLLVLIAGGLLVLRRRAPIALWGALWFAGSLAPAAMISTVLWPGFGRYLYLPCIGLALALGEGLQAVLQKTRRSEGAVGLPLGNIAVGALLSVVLLSAALRLHVVTAQYADNQTLYSSAVEQAPRPAYAYASLGAHYVNERDFARGVFFLGKAVELSPLEPRYLHDLIRAHLLSGQVQVAAQLARRGIAHAPADQCGDLRAMLVAALAGVEPELAVDELCTCLSLQPESRECREVIAPLLDPRGSQYPRLRGALDKAASECASAAGRAALIAGIDEALRTR